MTYLIKYVFKKKTENLNIHVFDMIIGINESKKLTKHVSCECKCKLDGKKSNSNQKWTNDKCWYECKKHHICVKDYVWNPPTCSCENDKYLASIINNSVITCNAIIEETKTLPKNFNERRVAYKTKKFCILLAILLITISLLIAVGIYGHMIKYWAKQKHLLPYHITDNKLKEVLY